MNSPMHIVKGVKKWHIQHRGAHRSVGVAFVIYVWIVLTSDSSSWYDFELPCACFTIDGYMSRSLYFWRRLEPCMGLPCPIMIGGNYSLRYFGLGHCLGVVAFHFIVPYPCKHPVAARYVDARFAFNCTLKISIPKKNTNRGIALSINCPWPTILTKLFSIIYLQFLTICFSYPQLHNEFNFSNQMFLFSLFFC